MKLRNLWLAALLSCTASLAHAAGLKVFQIPADAEGPALKVAEWSPCAAPAATVDLGPFALPAVRDCPVVGDKLPLIVVSHGFGGTSLGHHDTAEALADAGFIVVALNHPDDTASNPDKERSLAALASRPTDIERLIDYMLHAAPDAAKIDPERIGFFGFSRGGYTGLVLAGAAPVLTALKARCGDPTGAQCGLIDPAWAPPPPTFHEPRIKAYLIADPLSSVFPTKETLQGVSAPIDLWGSERGGDGVAPADVARVAADLPGHPALHVVPGANHFAFLTVCPPELAKMAPEVCTDPPGFDRAAFHKAFDAEVVAFFKTQLAPKPSN